MQGRGDADPYRMARSCVKGRNMSTNYLSAASVRTKNPAGVIATCGLMIMFDGYDLVVYGAVAPALLKESTWALNPAMVGRAAALTLVGMLLGALFAGTMADRIGRRKVVLLSLAGFSAMMIASAMTPNFLAFEITRFLPASDLARCCRRLLRWCWSFRRRNAGRRPIPCPSSVISSAASFPASWACCFWRVMAGGH